MRAKFTPATYMCCAIIFLLMVFFVPATLRAQEARGTISGTVSDTNKAAIPGATVKITDVSRGSTATVQTNDDGFFQTTYLLSSTYQVVVEVAGFKKFIREGLVVQVNDKLEVNAELEVGTPTETVTVTADTPLLETTSASKGQTVDARRISELPTPNGDPFALIGLAPGASYTGSARLDRPFEPTHIVGYAMDGTRGNRSDITIDGAPSTATANANEVIASYVPPPDIVQEFKVQTAAFDAQFGNTEGGTINISIKSGTNQLHGSGYWQRLPVKGVANDFFANANRQPLPKFEYDRYGGYIGGPVRLPKIYNGRNKTFFLFGYEAIKEARPRNNGTPTTPSNAMKAGDFTELLNLGSNYQIYNPFSARTEGTTIRRDPFKCDASGSPLPVLANGTQAAGTNCNKLPASLINPVAKNIVANYFPSPTSVGAANGVGNFAQPGLLERTDYWTTTLRIDHELRSNNRMFARVSWYPRVSNYNDYFQNLSTGEYFLFKSRQFAIDDVHTFNPTTVLNVKYSYNRFIRGTDADPEQRGFDLTKLGLPASYNALIPEVTRRFPRLDISGYQGTGIGGELRPNDIHATSAILNKALGSHSAKIGVDFRAYRENDFFFGNNQTGQFNFNGDWVRGPFSNSTGSPSNLGQSFAQLLLGLPSPGSFVSVPADYAEQSTTLGLFIHDDWRVNSRLALNLGLRWEVEGALTERYNKSVKGFDFGFVHPLEAAARANLNEAATGVLKSQFNVRGGLTFPGPDDRNLYETPKTNFMPRLGFAYKLSDDAKTVIRGGYGIYFGFLGQRRGDVIQPGFSATTQVNVAANNGLPDANGNRFIETLSNPFQTGLLAPVGAARGPLTNVGQSITYFNQSPKTPYNQRWELGFQREVAGGMVFEANYVGSRGTNIEITRNLNALPNKYLSTLEQRDSANNTFLTALVPNPFFGLALTPGAAATFTSPTIARERLFRPYPQFDALNTSTNQGYSSYHSLQLRLEKRFSKGYTLGVSYARSRFREAVEYLNAGDDAPFEMNSPADRPHRLTVNGIYELPFGKNRMFLSGDNPFLSKLVSGWQIQGIYAYQSGPMINFTTDVFFTGDENNIPIPQSQQTRQRFFNPDAGFVRASNATPQFHRRIFPIRFDHIRADNINTYDLSILKRTRITEGTSLELRAEFLNALNHPLFPNAFIVDPTNAAFGGLNTSAQENYPRRVQLMIKFLF